MGVRRCRDDLIALRNMYGRAKVERWAGIHVQAAHVSTPPLIAGGKKIRCCGVDLLTIRQRLFVLDDLATLPSMGYALNVYIRTLHNGYIS